VQEQGARQPIGWCGLQPLPYTRDFELFYGYATEAWGHGYATEAGRALLHVGFVALPVDRIVARVHAENQASQHVVTKLGMRKLLPVFNDIYGGLVDFFALAKGQQP
jgi:RimJ/RimL family protein N-acetyltransferase